MSNKRQLLQVILYSIIWVKHQWFLAEQLQILSPILFFNQPQTPDWVTAVHDTSLAHCIPRHPL